MSVLTSSISGKRPVRTVLLTVAVGVARRRLGHRLFLQWHHGHRRHRPEDAGYGAVRRRAEDQRRQERLLRALAQARRRADRRGGQEGRHRRRGGDKVFAGGVTLKFTASADKPLKVAEGRRRLQRRDHRRLRRHELPRRPLRRRRAVREGRRQGRREAGRRPRRHDHLLAQRRRHPAGPGRRRAGAGQRQLDRRQRRRHEEHHPADGRLRRRRLVVRADLVATRWA